MKENTKNKDYVTREELRERTRRSREKVDNISLTLPKGTKELIIELTGNKPSTECTKVIIEYVKQLQEKNKKIENC